MDLDDDGSDYSIAFPENHNVEARRLLPWTIHVVLLTLSSVMILHAYQIKSTVQRISEVTFYSPVLDELGDFSHTIKFNGSLDYPSIYRGPPNARSDAAWDAIAQQIPIFSVSEETIIKLGKSPVDSLRLPGSMGGDFMAAMEVFHQLHCLDLLRRRVYLDYYFKKDPEFWDNSNIPDHIEHCIEMLRQVLMCNSDLGIITYNFVESHDEAYPDFNTYHKCRDFDRVTHWALREATSHGIPLDAQTLITKTAGVVVLPTPP